MATTTTTTPPVTCMLQSITNDHNGYTCSHLCGPHNIESARRGSAPTVDSEGHDEGSTGLMNVLKQQEPQSQMPSQAYASYATGPL